MKVVEIIKIGREMLKMMSKYDVKMDDWMYLDMYYEYKEMRKKGFKYKFVIMQLSVTHSISRSKVERIIRRLDQNVN